MILKIKDAESRTNTENHPVRSMAEQTDTVLSDIWSDTNLVEWLTEEVNGRTFGLTPELSEKVNEAIQTGILPFSLNETLDKVNTGAKDGSSNVTAIHVLYENSIRQTLEHFAKTGQLESAKDLFDTIRTESDPSAETLVAYTVFTYAKGWTAEQIITDDDRFSKLWISNDQAGQDVRFGKDGDEKQIKAMPHYASNSPKHFRAKSVPHWFYQWTEDGLVLADLDDACAANKIAADQANVGATNLKKSYKGGVMDGFGRAARVLWW